MGSIGKMPDRLRNPERFEEPESSPLADAKALGRPAVRRGASTRPADTQRSLTEIEVALAESDYFNFVKNVVAFNVFGETTKLPLFHECDMLVLRPSGYLIEVELKRSWADFLADFRKTHKHDCAGDEILKELWYCVPSACVEKAQNKLSDERRDYSGIVAYDENLKLTFYGGVPMPSYRKLTPEEQFQVARYGAMRCVQLRKKLLLQSNKKPLRETDEWKWKEKVLVQYIEETYGDKLSKSDLNKIYYG